MRALDVGGKAISREELKERSGITEESLAYALQTGLIPGTTRVSSKGKSKAGGAAYTFREGHIPYCQLIQQIRDAGGNYNLAALALLVNKLPPYKAIWIRRAVIEMFVRRTGPDTTARQIRQAAKNHHWTAEDITRSIHDDPVRPSKENPEEPDEQDAQQLARDAAYLNPTRPATDRGQQAVDLRATLARLDMGRPLPEDKGLPDLSRVRILDTIEHASDEATWQCYHTAKDEVIKKFPAINEALRTLPLVRGRSNTEVVEMFLPASISRGVKPAAAVLPVLIAARLLKPTNDQVEIFATLFGLLDSEVELAAWDEHASTPLIVPDRKAPSYWLPSPLGIVESTIEGGATAN